MVASWCFVLLCFSLILCEVVAFAVCYCDEVGLCDCGWVWGLLQFCYLLCLVLPFGLAPVEFFVYCLVY